MLIKSVVFFMASRSCIRTDSPPAWESGILYPPLHIFVYRLTVVLQAEVSRSGIATPEPKEETWCDLVDDLWERYLPYFRIRGYVVTSRPPTSSSFSGDADPSSTILTELTRSDSDQNLLETLKREQAHQKPVPSPPTTSEYVCMQERSSTWILFSQNWCSNNWIRSSFFNMHFMRLIWFSLIEATEEKNLALLIQLTGQVKGDCTYNMVLNVCSPIKNLY